MANLSHNGYSMELISKEDLYTEVNQIFDALFDDHLLRRYDLKPEEFEEIIKEKFPEKFL